MCSSDLQFPLPNAGLLPTLLKRLGRQGQGRRDPFLSRLLLQDFLLPDKQVAELFLNTSQSADQPFIPGMIPEVSVHEIQPFLSPGALFQLLVPGFPVCLDPGPLLLTIRLPCQQRLFLIKQPLIEGTQPLQDRHARLQCRLGLGASPLGRLQSCTH